MMRTPGNRFYSFVRLRISVCGATAGILVSTLFVLTSGLDLSITSLIPAYCFWLVVIPLSFFSAAVKRFLLTVLMGVCNVPCNLAFFLMGLIIDEAYLNPRFKAVSEVAKELFSALSGYPSNLTLLHDSDYVLSRLPTRR